MITTWYHGTNETSAINICEKGIDFSKSKKELDFGIGFYLTDDIKVAERRARKTTNKYNRRYKKKDRPAVVSVDVDTDIIDNLQVRHFDYCNNEWLRFVLANRLSPQFVQSSRELMLEHNLDLKYDVVIGSIADSDVSQLVEYIEMGNTDINKLSVYELFTDDGRTLGEQMSLHTHKSLKCVKKKSFHVLDERRN